MKNPLISVILLSLLAIYRLIGWRFRSLLVPVLSFLAWRLAPAERQIAIRQLADCITNGDTSLAQRIAKGVVRHLACSLIEALEMYRGNPNVLEQVRYAKGARERLDAALAAGRGCVFASAHIGNWELLAARLCADDYRTSTFYKPSYDPGLDRLVRDFRSRYGIGSIDRNSQELTDSIRKQLESGGILGLLIDQDTKVPGVFVPFFGTPAFTPSGAASIAMANHAPLLIGWIHRRSGGHELYIEEVRIDYETSDKKAEILAATIKATALFEAAIRKKPEQWVWFHRRWKTRPQNEKIN